MKVHQSYSSVETKRFGVELVKKLLRDKKHVSKKHALILAIKGDLGSGKTTFVQGFLRGLGVRGRVNSPTFVLIKRYAIRGLRYKYVFHIDCYRLKKAKELLDLGLREILGDPKNIVLIEWAEKVSRRLPQEIGEIFFKYGPKENERLISTRNLNRI